MAMTINKREIERMTQEIQKEFDKHPIRVEVRADQPTNQIIADDHHSVNFIGPPAGNTTNYYGPVIHGNADGAQLAWNNRTVNQTQKQIDQITPGYEAIAQAIVKTLESLPLAGLNDDDLADANEVGQEILLEVVQPEPNRSKIRRALASLKGLLAPLAAGLVAGGAEGAHEWARVAIEQLGKPF